MVGILIIGAILVILYIHYWWSFVRKAKIKNTPANIKLRVSKEFQDLVLGNLCEFRFKLGEKGKVFYKMKHFEPCDDDKIILIVLEKSDGKEKIDD
jgi:hypothetical protein